MRLFSLLAASLLWVSGLCAADESPVITPAMLATAGELIQRARRDNEAFAIVESLTTEVGPRLAGTEAEARARQWALSRLRELGFPRVRVEPFPVPLWLRGVERARIVAPFPQPLTITALGGSASTGPGGVTGEVATFDTLAALAAAADGSLRGRIAFIDEPMTRTQDGSGYSVAVAKRREAAYEAQRLGALALLIRSVGTSSHRSAHTGQMRDAGSSRAFPRRHSRPPTRTSCGAPWRAVSRWRFM